MAFRVADSVLNDACDAAVGNADGGSIQFYDGSPPGAVGNAPGSTLLAEADFAATAFGSASGGEAVAAGVPLETTGITDGNIGWCRIIDSGGTVLWDEDDVSTSASSAVTVNTVTVAEGVDFAVTSYEFFVAPDA